MADHDDSSTRSSPGLAQAPQEPADPAEQTVVPQLTQKQAAKVSAPARAMILSMAALLLLVLPIFWLMPRPDGQVYRPSVDVAQEAGYAADVAEFDPLAPELGDGWSPNYARWDGASDGVPAWEAGWVTPQSRFAGLTQTADANPTWTLQQLQGMVQTGTRDVDGVTWQTYSGTDDDDRPISGWVGELPDSTVILQGSADDEELAHAASAVVQAAEQG